jgi:signal transduction histidine kinase
VGQEYAQSADQVLRGCFDLRKFFSDRWAFLRGGLFIYAQLAMLGGIIIVALISVGSPATGEGASVLFVAALTALTTVAALFPPWHRLPRVWLIAVPVIDVLIIAHLEHELFASQPGVSNLVLIPTLWLAYSFNLAGVVVAIISDYFVALFPYIAAGWPTSSDAWGDAVLIPAIVSGVGIAVYLSARHIQKQRDELTVAYDELRKVVDSRDEFLRTISHELRTPLTSMIGYLEVIEDSVDLAKQGVVEPFDIIGRNAQRLLSLINSLITEAHGRPEPKRRSESVNDLANRALDAARPAAAKAGVVISAARLESVRAELDAGDITEVLNELLSNAIKFNHWGGTISVSVARDDDDVVIRVADSGIGIWPDERPRIFERFFRGASARRSVIAGTGLGLSTVKSIVDAHSGTIGAASVEPHGTTMVLRLPLVVPRPAKVQRT